MFCGSSGLGLGKSIALTLFWITFDCVDLGVGF